MPKGAEELLIAIQTPSPKGHRGIPALLWGAPGAGKSSFIESLARDDCPVMTLIASIHAPTDFSGLPVHENGAVRFAPPGWTFAFDEVQQGILFLDELTTAPPSVQAALLRVILERKVGFKSLPHGVRVVSAANPPDMAAGGWELSPPLRNRFVHLQWELAGRDYVDALEDGFARPELPAIDPQAHAARVALWRIKIAAMLRRSPHLTRTEPSEEDYAFASPRTWDFAIHLMASCDLLHKQERDPVFVHMLEGCVGRGAATAFLEFMRNLHLPDPEKVLDGEPVDVKKFREDELYVLFSSLAAALLQRKEERRARFVDAMLAFLDLALPVCEGGKVDAVFVPVRRVAREQILPYAIACAQRENRLNELQTLLRRVFEDTPLREFAEWLI